MINALPLEEQVQMSNSPLFKRAFVRGLNAELIRQGVVVYPSKEAADATADFVADESGMPDPYLENDKLNLKVASVLVEHLTKGAEYQCQQAGNKFNPAVTKTAQAETAVSLANSDAWAIMEKCAAETGSLVEGGDNKNDMPAAASNNAEAALENKQRPENYANLGEKGVGNYEGKGEGTVGTEQKHPEAPKSTDSGSNSVTEQSSKSASLASIIRRIGKTAESTGSLITGGGNPNDLPAAAASNAEAALEQSMRPEGYANLGERGVGQTEMQVPGNAVVGTEQPHSLAPGATDSGSNSIIEHSKNAFDQLFENTAKQVVPYLPENMQDEQKVAHVRAMMGLETSDRAGYLQNLYTGLGAKKEAAAAVRNHFIKAAEESCDSSEEKKEEGPGLPAFMKKEEKSEEKKEEKSASLSALRSRLKTVNA
jgi:hypothetical protein